MNRVDAIALVEAAYRFDLQEPSWLLPLTSVSRPSLDHGLGVIAMTYDAQPDYGVSFSHVVVEGDPRVADAHQRMHQVSSPAIRRAFFFSGPPLGTFLDHLREVPPAELAPFQAQGRGIRDAVGIQCLDGEGHGMVLSAASVGQVCLGPDAPLWNAVGAHFAAALRLRRRLGRPPVPADADAVFTPGGRCLDARPAAAPRSVRDRLRDEVVRLQRARGPLRRKDVGEALCAWPGLADGTWSLVEHFDRDGRHFVLACANPPDVRDPRALTERERQCVSFAALGQGNKQIGYELGLAASTVATHLADAARKLSIHRRAEFARFFVTARTGTVPVAGAEPLRFAAARHDDLDGEGLTPAESEVAEAAASGASNGEIARRRSTSPRTVANQLEAIYRKLGVSSRTELAAKFAGARHDAASTK